MTSWLILLMGISLNLFQTEWITFKDEFNTFSVKVPSEMEVVYDDFETSIGVIEVISYQCKPKNGSKNLTYLVQEWDYPDGFFHKDSTDLIEEIFTTSVEESVAKLNGNLDYRNVIQLNNFPGILYRVSNDDPGFVMKSKAYIVDGTFYSLQVYAKKDDALNKDMDYFLDSFKLIF